MLIQTFDELWTTYEKKYVYELMVIEQDARRFVQDVSTQWDQRMDRVGTQQPGAASALTALQTTLTQSGTSLDSAMTSSSSDSIDLI